MVHWESRVTPFIYQPGNFASNFVPTVETTRISYLLELLISRNNYVMLVGSTGARDMRVCILHDHIVCEPHANMTVASGERHCFLGYLKTAFDAPKVCNSSTSYKE